MVSLYASLQPHCGPVSHTHWLLSPAHTHSAPCELPACVRCGAHTVWSVRFLFCEAIKRLPDPAAWHHEALLEPEESHSHANVLYDEGPSTPGMFGSRMRTCAHTRILSSDAWGHVCVCVCSDVANFTVFLPLNHLVITVRSGKTDREFFTLFQSFSSNRPF